MRSPTQPKDSIIFWQEVQFTNTEKVTKGTLVSLKPVDVFNNK